MIRDGNSTIKAKTTAFLKQKVPHKSIKCDPDRLRGLLEILIAKDLKSQQHDIRLFRINDSGYQPYKNQHTVTTRAFTFRDKTTASSEAMMDELSQSYTLTPDSATFQRRDGRCRNRNRRALYATKADQSHSIA